MRRKRESAPRVSTPRLLTAGPVPYTVQMCPILHLSPRPGAFFFFFFFNKHTLFWGGSEAAACSRRPRFPARPRASAANHWACSSLEGVSHLLGITPHHPRQLALERVTRLLLTHRCLRCSEACGSVGLLGGTLP